MHLLRRVLSLSSAFALVTALSLTIAFAGVANAAPSSAAAPVRFTNACGSASPGFARCFAIQRLGGTTAHAQAVAPNVTSCTNPATGYTPCDLQSAYNVVNSTGGVGQTVAIVDAFNDPNAETDLGTYRAQFGLSACTTANGCFKKVNQSGVQGSYPRNNTGWSEEISLDLDMVSAFCPNCHILLVEATSNSNANLAASVDTAVRLGATEVSNSYGGAESSTETSTDTHYNHPGVAITASSGDGGFGVEYPAASRFVTAVGGTTLTRASNARGWTETAWSGAGSGCSAFEAQQTWQNIANITAHCSRRAVADVSAVANPNTGVDVFDSFNESGWLVFGGTSVASPIIASIYALAGNASSVTYGSFPYSHTSSLNDVTSGSNGNCGNDLCNAGVGWDGPTGLGTPNGTGGF
ncbi:MAG TPA: S53 family peptidase [Ktedonobacterales bacterium]|nr:S53 family peptidase [Ktedonobacterales bacterium]